MCSEHILHSDGTEVSIFAQLERALSDKFQSSVKHYPSIYGEGEACGKIFNIIKEMDLKKLGMKEFFEIDNIKEKI